jgi:CRP/FNR family transcriptional regulator, cyclic AMP receptor protein
VSEGAAARSLCWCLPQVTGPHDPTRTLAGAKVTDAVSANTGLIRKQAGAGEVLGLSAALSGTNYEVTAETVTPCQLNFVGRRDLVNLLHNEGEMGVQSALWLSHEFQGVYRDIHGLVLARSSQGRLARLLLSSCAPPGSSPSKVAPAGTDMTHEEMAQRIGTSRETVTRWLTELNKKKLIQSDGDTLFIRDYAGLEAMTV